MQGPKARLSPSEVQALAKRRGSLHRRVTLPGSTRAAPRPRRRGSSLLTVPSGPGPQTLPSCHHGGSQAPRTQPALRLLRPPKAGLGSRSCGPMQTAAAIRSQRQGRGRGSPRLKAWARPVGAVARALELCRTQHPGPPSSPTGPRREGLEGPWEKTLIHLLPHTPHPARTATWPTIGQGRPPPAR